MNEDDTVVAAFGIVPPKEVVDAIETEREYLANRLEIWYEQDWLVRFGLYESKEELIEDRVEHEDCPDCQCEYYEEVTRWVEGQKLRIGTLHKTDFDLGKRDGAIRPVRDSFSDVARDAYCGYMVEDDFKKKELRVITNHRINRKPLDVGGLKIEFAK